MKMKKKSLATVVLIALGAMAFVSISTSCNRAITYEDGMFDYNEIYDDDNAASETSQLNSEIDNDDQERY